MQRLLFLLLSFSLVFSFSLASANASDDSSCPHYLDVEVRKLNSKTQINLCSLYQAQKPLLVVNTASHCGFTKQFSGLEALYKKYKQRGLTVVGFPSNDFKQEEKSEEGTARVCYKNYGVTFPMFEHVKVKGEDAHSLFSYLASKTREPKWNFNKYLITKNDGVTHFGSRVKPLESDLEKAILSSL